MQEGPNIDSRIRTGFTKGPGNSSQPRYPLLAPHYCLESERSLRWRFLGCYGLLGTIMMNSPLFSLLLRWAVLALGVVLAARLIPGIGYDSMGTLVVVVLLLSLCNTIFKPLLTLFALPFILFTAGFGIVIINALLFLFVGYLVDGFRVDGFWPALGGSAIVSLTNLGISTLLRNASAKKAKTKQTERKDKDVIDI